MGNARICVDLSRYQTNRRNFFCHFAKLIIPEGKIWIVLFLLEGLRLKACYMPRRCDSCRVHNLPLKLCKAKSCFAKRNKWQHQFIQPSNQSMLLLATFGKATAGFAYILSHMSKLYKRRLLIGAFSLVNTMYTIIFANKLKT